jgi:uncharacterized protein involved in exopolysaccharide biosynthesis
MKDPARLNAMKFFDILWKRRWYGLCVFFLIASGTAIYAALTSNMYKSETRVAVGSPVISDNIMRLSTPEERANSIRQQISNRTFLERMIEQLQMYGCGTHTDFVMDDAVKTAQKHIGVKVTSYYTFTISFTASDPHLAQTVARQLALELIRIGTHAKKVKVLATDQFIDEELRKISDDLAAQEEKIKQFKKARLDKLPERARERQFSALLIDLNAQKTRYDHFMKLKSDRVRMTSEADKRNEFPRIIDEANLPVNAEFPNRLQIILMGIGGGLLLGIGAAFVREILEPAITPL